MNNRKIIFMLLLVGLAVVITSGCLFGTNQGALPHSIDPPQEDYLSSEDDAEIEFDTEEGRDPNDASLDEAELEEQSTNTKQVSEVDRKLYVFDHQGYVVPITVRLPHTESVAKQSLEHLVVDGPITSLLPDGMRAVLPAGTELSINILQDEQKAVVDFSNHVIEYQATDEKGILEAITWTLTEFDGIEHVQININGYEQDVMPLNGTPIPQTLNRKDGINIELGDAMNIGRHDIVTLYFQAQTPSGTHGYDVPVSRVVDRQYEDLISATIQEYIKGPSIQSGLFSELDINTQLLSAAINQDKVATLDFSEHFLSFDQDESKVSDDILRLVTLSLTETGLIDEVQFMINGDNGFMTFSGNDLSQNVSRPQSINETGF